MNRLILYLVIVFSFITGKTFAGIAILNGLTQEKTTSAGTVYQGFIEIQNNDDKPIDVKLYKTDLLLDSTGAKLFSEPGNFKRSNASWLDISPVYITLRPKEKRSIGYEVRVPNKMELSGTYWSVIMVEGVEPIDTLNQKGMLSITTSTRYAIQVISNIENGGNRLLKFGSVKIDQNKEGNKLLVKVTNEGDFLLVPEIAMEIFDSKVKSVLNLTARTTKIYPGWTIDLEFDITPLKAGKYESVLMADCGDDLIFGGRLNFAVK